jgi:hypothetical protein
MIHHLVERTSEPAGKVAKAHGETQVHR